MDQSSHALEFVTITNPDEIKDPAKQKAIRRQARRRENGSKSASRKPFKITFDLPGGGIHSLPEQSIVRRQWPSSDNTYPVEYEQIKLVLPSFKISQNITTGCGLMFTSPLPATMHTRVVQLVNFVSQLQQGGRLCPLIDLWWRLAQLDSTAFFVVLANASRLINKAHPFDPKESQEAIALYTRSIQCLQKRLQTTVDGLSEGIIVSILEFAYYDFLAQNLTRWLVHMSGLANIIQRRGGIQTLFSSKMVLLLNFWIDVSGSFIFDNAPFFPPPQHLLDQVTNKMPPSRIMQKWNEIFPELSDITNFLSHAANLSSYIDERASNAEIWKDDLFVAKTFNAVVHQFLSLQRYTEEMRKGLLSPQLVMREAIRRTCLILFAMLRDRFSVHPSGISQHQNRVKEILVQHPIDWSPFQELRLWVLLSASLATEDVEIPWYIDEIHVAMGQMRISGWNDMVETVRGILWMEETFRIKSERLKQLFDSSAVQERARRSTISASQR